MRGVGAEWAGTLPVAPREQERGYGGLVRKLAAALSEIAVFAAVSREPIAGSQG